MARFAPVRVEVKMMEFLVVRETIAALTAERDAALARLSALEAKVGEADKDLLWWTLLADSDVDIQGARNLMTRIRAILTRDEGGNDAKMEAAMDDFAANTTPGGTWIERDEGGERD